MRINGLLQMQLYSFHISIVFNTVITMSLPELVFLINTGISSLLYIKFTSQFPLKIHY